MRCSCQRKSGPGLPYACWRVSKRRPSPRRRSRNSGSLKPSSAFRNYGMALCEGFRLGRSSPGFGRSCRRDGDRVPPVSSGRNSMHPSLSMSRASRGLEYGSCRWSRKRRTTSPPRPARALRWPEDFANGWCRISRSASSTERGRSRCISSPALPNTGDRATGVGASALDDNTLERADLGGAGSRERFCTGRSARALDRALGSARGSREAYRSWRTGSDPDHGPRP
jgi:hypothetical protein